MRFAIVGRSEKVVGVAERLEEGEEREGYIEIGTESDSEPEFPARKITGKGLDEDSRSSLHELIKLFLPKSARKMKPPMLWTARQVNFLRQISLPFHLIPVEFKSNGNALKLSCEFLRVFVTEAVQRAATIAEAEGVSKIEATHLERILPQLLLDF
ncbi:hypothetical protein TIFTF001_025989 [Ficus carica]|uniref:Centromere protein X n=1 Tax=Ficus carica TaxID=3494 RepID=A0AA88ARL1_FICCA|nr:hypothetical protein TIFTF001_025989 [Ficus carica]